MSVVAKFDFDGYYYFFDKEAGFSERVLESKDATKWKDAKAANAELKQRGIKMYKLENVK